MTPLYVGFLGLLSQGHTYILFLFSFFFSFLNTIFGYTGIARQVKARNTVTIYSHEIEGWRGQGKEMEEKE